jgi:hypothetical protein
LLAIHVKQISDAASNSQNFEVDEDVLEILRCSLLPAMSQVPPNHGVQMELFNVFRLLPVPIRFKFVFAELRQNEYRNSNTLNRV